MGPDEASGWHFRVEDLESKLRDDTKLIIVNFPHNPTGAMISADSNAAHGRQAAMPPGNLVGMPHTHLFYAAL